MIKIDLRIFISVMALCIIALIACLALSFNSCKSNDTNTDPVIDGIDQNIDEVKEQIKVRGSMISNIMKAIEKAKINLPGRYK